MSWIKRGKNVPFTRYKTFEGERVQKRMDSIIPAVQSKVEQALAVDATRCIIYKKAKFGLVCSCNRVDNLPGDTTGGLKSVGRESDIHQRNVEITPANRTMFGGGSSGAVSLDDINPAGRAMIDAVDLATDGDEFDTRWDGGNVVNCGICYRQGVQPGFAAVGYQYVVMTHHHVNKFVGYSLDPSVAPLLFRQVRKEGYVDFDVTVPKYFKTVKYSIRENDKLYSAEYRPMAVINNQPTELTMALLDQHRGQNIIIRVRNVETFTHCVMIFDQGVQAVRCNISEEANVLNYDQELTVGNLTVVLPASVGMIEPEDIIVLPDRNYVLKVMEAPKKRNSRQQAWEWVATTRPVQRKEIQYNIDKGFIVR